MNKFKIILVSAFILLCITIACNKRSASESEIVKAKKTSNLYNSNIEREFEYTVIIIDSCEYLMWRTANGYLQITHKGNCKNSIHTKTVEKLQIEDVETLKKMQELEAKYYKSESLLAIYKMRYDSIKFYDNIKHLNK
jgi:hypothetical protein